MLLQKRDGSDIVAIDTFAREHTQTITFSAYDIASNAYKKVSDTAGAQGQQLSRAPSTVSASTGQSDFEIAEPEAPVRFEVDLALEGVGISLINKRMVELAYCSFRGFHVNYKDTDVSTSISFSCKWIQFDNQLYVRRNVVALPLFASPADVSSPSKGTRLLSTCFYILKSFQKTAKT